MMIMYCSGRCLRENWERRPTVLRSTPSRGTSSTPPPPGTKVEVPLEDMRCQEKTNQRDRIGIMKKYINENILFIFASPFLPRPCSFLQILEITVVTTTDWSVALRYPSLSGRFLWPVRFLPAPLQSTSTLLPHQSHVFRMVNIPRRFSFCSSYPGFP